MKEDYSHLMSPDELKKYENLLIVYHNDLNRATLGMMSEQEQKVFFAVCSRCRDKREELMTFNFSEIEAMLGGNKLGNARIADFLIGVNEKLQRLSCYIKDKDKNKLTQMVLFSTFITDLDDKTLTVRVNKDFLYILNNLNKNFTTFKLIDLTSLKGKYVKGLYRMLLQFQGTGYMRISGDKLINILAIPESFELKQINQKIINPSIQKLNIRFPDLRVEEIRKGKSFEKIDFIFKFTPTLTKEKEMEEKLKQLFIQNEIENNLIENTKKNND